MVDERFGERSGRIVPESSIGAPVKVLALDFDGVLSDSAAESFVVALRTHAVMRPGDRLAKLAAELRGAEPEQIRRHPLYRGFVALMPLGNRAEDFAVVLHILDGGGEVDDQADYDAWRDREPPGFMDAFHQQFYRERAELRDHDRAGWLSLLDPYRPIVELIRRRAGDVTLCIATAKDRPSVEVLLDRYGIADLFPAEHVIDKEYGRTKRAHLTALRDRLDVAFGEITFVDDKANHLIDVASLGVRCALAAWGYNGERERRAVGAAGHLVCSFEDAERKLFGTLR